MNLENAPQLKQLEPALAKNGDWLAFFGSLKKACLSPLFALSH